MQYDVYGKLSVTINKFKTYEKLFNTYSGSFTTGFKIV